MFDEQLNTRARRLCQQAIEAAGRLDIRVSDYRIGSMRATVLDFGVDRIGTLAGGVMLARICLADLADIHLSYNPATPLPHPWLTVTTDFPLLGCIASQYAGWPFSSGSYFSMCSGPARLKRGREEILSAYRLTSNEMAVVGVLESNRLPTDDELQDFADQCQCSEIYVCVAKTSSLPGTIQVVARSVETAMHKLYELGFDLSKVLRAMGTAPIPPIGQDDYQSMGWTNDAILFAGDVVLWMEDASQILERIQELPSNSSKEFGSPFVSIFEKYDRDFYRVDRLLFSPARVTVNCASSGVIRTAGQVHVGLLRESFA